MGIKHKVSIIRNNKMLGFESRQEDAYLIAEIIRILSDRNISVENAKAILPDTQRIIPRITKL